MLVYGIRHFGKVDEVPGHFHVATRCHHLWYFPLVPLDSWIIPDGARYFDPGGGEWNAGGVRLPSIRWRSVVVAWLRWLLAVVGLVFGVNGLVGLLDVVLDGADARGTLSRLGVAAGASVAIALSRRLSRASRSRAEVLCKGLGLSEEAASQVRRAVAGR